ncbi:MAG: hypothetical protein NT117_04835 [Gammaproteobacteria bacterium]|nr:hypothetical protein [Gammaproteobacteria bacterium]
MNSFRKASLAFTGLLALSTSFVSAPAFADGECLEWNVTGSWPLTQSNGTRVILRLQQTGTHLQGVGEYSYHSDSAEQQYTVSGPVDGQLENGNLVRVAAYWSNGSVGLYVGKIQADGGMSGYTSDRNNVNNKATFVASASAQCVSRAAVAPPKPTVALGRVPRAEGAPNPNEGKSFCELAAAARAANRPTAAALQRRCDAQLAASAAAAPTDVKEDHSNLADVFGSAPAATDVKKDHSNLADVFVSAPAADAPAPAAQPFEKKDADPPVEAPHDLRVVSLTFGREGKVTQVQLGSSIIFFCRFAVNRVASAFAPGIGWWRGEIIREPLGRVSGETYRFDPEYYTREYVRGATWTPQFFGKYTFHCRVNHDFAYAEANPDNNEVTAVLEVIDRAPPAQ